MTTLETTISSSRLRRLIDAELPELIAIRHDLHTHPELGYNEHRTSGVVQRELGKVGVGFVAGLAAARDSSSGTVKNAGGGTGILAHIPGPPEGSSSESARAIGLRADMDALPITEETGASYCSTNPGIMHACGHDGHTTMLIGAARVLAKIAREEGSAWGGKSGVLPRPVTFIFQPAEEGGAGGRRMVEEGCLSGSVLGPPVGMVFGLHGWPVQRLGMVSTRVGPMLAAADEIEIIVKGTGSHAAFPQISADPILCGSAIVQGLQQICSRNVSPLDSIVVSVTQFHGGTAHNIIPETVHLHGTVRTLLPETQELAQRRIVEIAEGIASAHGCRAEVNYRLGYPITCNDPKAVAIFNSTAKRALGEDWVEELAEPVMGGEDFSFYCREVPACFFTLGLLPKGQEVMPMLHQPQFDFNDDALATGVEMFCRLAMGEQA